MTMLAPEGLVVALVAALVEAGDMDALRALHDRLGNVAGPWARENERSIARRSVAGDVAARAERMRLLSDHDIRWMSLWRADGVLTSCKQHHDGQESNAALLQHAAMADADEALRRDGWLLMGGGWTP